MNFTVETNEDIQSKGKRPGDVSFEISPPKSMLQSRRRSSTLGKLQIKMCKLSFYFQLALPKWHYPFVEKILSVSFKMG